MSYLLTRFDDVDLPMLEATQNIGTGRADSPRTRLPSGGAYRMNGTDRARRGETTVRATGQIVGTTLAQVEAGYVALRGLWGRYAKLYRKGDGTGADQWVWAECVDVPLDRERRRLWMPVDMTFVVDSAFWHGTTHGVGATWGDPLVTWGSGYTWGDVADLYTLDTSPKTIISTNEGNYPVDDAVLTVTAGALDLTGLTLVNTRNRTGFAWVNTLKATRKLEINIGGQSVVYPTTLSSGAAVGATTLTVTTSQGAAVGASVSVVLDTGETYDTTVATIPDGTSITIPAPGLPWSAASGKRVAYSAYSGFTPRLGKWLVLEEGDNELTVTRTGGGVTTTLLNEYYSGHV